MRNLINQSRAAAIGMALALAMAASTLAPAAAQECKIIAPAKSSVCDVSEKTTSVTVQASGWYCGVKIKDVEALINKFQNGPFHKGTAADANRVVAIDKMGPLISIGAAAADYIAENLLVAILSPTHTGSFPKGKTEHPEPFRGCFLPHEITDIGDALYFAAGDYLKRHGS